MGIRTLAAEVLGSYPWREPSQSLPLTPPKSRGRLQCWVASGKTTNREGTQPHPSTVKWIKVLLGSDRHSNREGTQPHPSTIKWIKVLLSSDPHSNSQLYPPPVPPIKPLR